MKTKIFISCCFISFCLLNKVRAQQSLDFENTIYYTAVGNVLTSSAQTLAAFNYSSAPPSHPLLNDGIYLPTQDYQGHNLWVRVRHIADDPNGTSVGHTVNATTASPFRLTGFGGWWGFLYQFDIYKDAVFLGTPSNTLNGLFPINITVESIETLSDPEWIAFELLNPESSDWTLNSINFTGNNNASNPAFSAVSIPYNQTGFVNSFPPASKNIYAIDNSPGYDEFRMSASDVSQFTYGYEYMHVGGYQGFRLFFGVEVLGGPVQKPGSGTALSFNGTSNGVDLGSAFYDQNFTVEMWLKPGATQVPWANIIDNNQMSTANWLIQQYGYYPNANQYYYYISGTTSTGTFTLQPNVWQHLAFVKSATDLFIYVNGIMVENTPWSGTVDYYNNYLRLGRSGSGGGYWKGSMDEVRIWNTALSKMQIRDRMCHKIIPADALYGNLTAYYNFDEGTGYNLFDSKNNFNGAINGPTWQTSAAPIGNFSTHNYSGGASGAALTHPTRGDALTGTLTAGAANGIHVYNVTEVPNTTNGITGVGNNNAYFGLFAVNGSNPTSDAVYNYANAFPGTNENDLHLFKRNDNAGTAWFDCNALIDVNSNTLITNGGQHTEYMIGSLGVILPITGLVFQASKENNNVNLSWHTLSEINSSRFEIERSKNGIKYETIGEVQAAGNSSIRKDYYYTDAVPGKNLNYYRLKLIDIDGKFVYSPVRLVKFDTDNSFIVYPNPVKRGESLQLILQNVTANKIEIINSAGQVVYSNPAKLNGSISIPISFSLATGQYAIRIVCENKVDVQKILIQ